MKKFFTLIMAMVLCVSIYAQNQGGAPKRNWSNDGPRKEFNPEQFKKDMRDFVTREANLTEQEANRFFPMLSEMQEKQFKLMQQQRELMQKGKAASGISESEYEKIITQTTALEIESKKIEQTYYKKFHTVLSWKKVYAVRQALNRFQMEALKRFHPGKGGQQRNEQKGQDHQAGGGRR